MTIATRVIAIGLGCVALLPPASAAQSDTAGLGVAIHKLVVESRTGGGTRSDQVLFAADSTSAGLLGLAGISVASGSRPATLLCPGSTNADAQPAPPPVGYVVKLVLTATADSTVRQIDITRSCFYRFRGGGRPYAEGGSWELRLREGRWYVARSLGFFET